MFFFSIEYSFWTFSSVHAFFFPRPFLCPLNLLCEHAPPLRRAVCTAALAVMLALHGPRANPPQTEIARLRSVIVKRISPYTAPRIILFGCHTRCSRQVHRVALLAQGPTQRSSPTTMRALIRSAIASVGAQAQFVLLVVAGRAVVRLVADVRVPGSVGIEGAESAATCVAAAGDGGAFVGAGGGAVVAVFELGDLVAKPALDAPRSWSRAAVRVGFIAKR